MYSIRFDWILFFETVPKKGKTEVIAEPGVQSGLRLQSLEREAISKKTVRQKFQKKMHKQKFQLVVFFVKSEDYSVGRRERGAAALRWWCSHHRRA